MPDAAPHSDRREADLSIEVVLLIVLALYMVLFGTLLFWITAGALPYNRDSAYGLFLVVICLQAVTLGKTPFGDVGRTWLVLIGGILGAVFGMLACFIPGLVSGGARLVTGVVLTAGGLTLLVQLLSGDKAVLWLRMPGLPRRATLAALSVYVLLLPLGLITLAPGLVADQVTAALLLACGAALGLLAISLFRLAAAYPPPVTGTGVRRAAGAKPVLWLLQESSLPLSLVTLLVTGTLLVLLALLLVPVNLGLLPFSPDGQLGLLTVINAVQIMALGDTPVGHYRRSWPLVLGGIAFAVFGIIACIVPGLVTAWLQMLLGTLSVAGGVLGLVQTLGSLRRAPTDEEKQPPSLSPALVRLGVLQLAVNLLGLIFGVSMLVPSLLPGLAIAGILALNGLLVFLLASALLRLKQPLPD